MTKKSYTPVPEVPAELQQRYQLVLEVLSGALTVSEAARRAGMSRNRFQTLMHRGLEGMLERLAPGSPGRPAKPLREAELEEELGKLQRENSRLQERLAMTERLMGIAGEFLRGRPSTTKRESRPKAAKATTTKKEDEEHEGRKELLTSARAIRSAGGRASWVARVIGVSPSTLRRWNKGGERALPRSSRRKPIEPAVAAKVELRVRQLHGLVGAEALRRAVGGISRRQAAQIKSATLTAMERERLAATERVEVTQPGVVRGFDGMDINTLNGRCWMLVSADASVPYRTSATVVSHYNGEAVATALKEDFDKNGAPLVIRLDRASAHKTPAVRAVLDEYGVIALHGPARYPRYYGQHERQNRDHRAWIDRLAPSDPRELEVRRDDMLEALNAHWPRRRLNWRTPQQAWQARPQIGHNRQELREEVRRQAAQLMSRNDTAKMSQDLAERLAIEHALSKRGLLRRSEGTGC